MGKKKEEREFIAVLENIRSLYNVGSVFRTADGLGFKKIYLCGYTPAPISGRQKLSISKTALGAEENIFWETKRRAASLLRNLKKQGYFLIGLESKTKNPVFLNRLKLSEKYKKIALVLGNEVEGLSPAALKICNKVVEIPMFGKKESYNVAVSFGIAGFVISNLE